MAEAAHALLCRGWGRSSHRARQRTAAFWRRHVRHTVPSVVRRKLSAADGQIVRGTYIVANLLHDVGDWPMAANFSLAPDVSFRGEAEVGRTAEHAGSVANDPKRTYAGIQ
jgi:hypothetical protein